MKQGEDEATNKQPWEPMKLTCVGHIDEVVEAGQPILITVIEKEIPTPPP